MFAILTPPISSSEDNVVNGFTVSFAVGLSVPIPTDPPVTLIPLLAVITPTESTLVTSS